MRLWHQLLLPHLDKQRLLGQHRECCALRGMGWQRKHATVDYVFKYDLAHLYAYHLLVMHEIIDRYNYCIDPTWYNRTYRGKNIGYVDISSIGDYVYHGYYAAFGHEQKDYDLVYPEHDDKYMKECLLNLKAKGAELENGKTIEQMLIELELKGA